MITIHVLHTIYDTDFGPYHSWQCALAPSSHNDRDHVLRNARQLARELKAHGIMRERYDTELATPGTFCNQDGTKR